mmetsp:Transcript_71133/g.199946  ORF Transcript_71133/g.199946 Transcript_71133/m.199946 type:complete len:954 (+) Transcript_71133:187-3048(+)
MALDAVCLAVLWLDVGLMVCYIGRKKALSSWRALYFAVVASQSIGLLVSVIQPRWIRPTRAVRAFAIMARMKAVREIMGTIKMLIPAVLSISLQVRAVLGVWLLTVDAWVRVNLTPPPPPPPSPPSPPSPLSPPSPPPPTTLQIGGFILLFVGMAVHLKSDSFQDIPANAYEKGGFDHAFAGFSRLFALITAENFQDLFFYIYADGFTVETDDAMNSGLFENPKVTLAGFMSCVLLVLFTSVGIFGLTSVLFATVVEFYWKFHKLQILHNRKITRKSLMAAFNCLDAANIGTINFATWCKFYHELVPHGNWNDALLRYDLLDHDKHELIDPIDFLSVPDVMSLRITRRRVSEVPHPMIPDCVVTLQQNLLKPHHSWRRAWEWAVIGLISTAYVGNLVAWKDMSAEADFAVAASQLCLSCILMCELLVYTSLVCRARTGKGLFQKIGAYEIDIIFNLASLIMASLVVSGVLHTKLVWISAVLLQVRYLRVSLNIRNVCRTFHGVAASVTSLLVVVAIAIHVYATIGTGLFSNLDCCEAADDDNSGNRRQLMWRMLAASKEDVDVDLESLCYPYFGNFILSCWTMYTIVIEADWADVMDEIRTCRHKTYDVIRFSHATDPFFYTWIFFVNMVLINLLLAMVTHGYFAMSRITRTEKFSLLVKMHDTKTIMQTHHDDEGSHAPKSDVTVHTLEGHGLETQSIHELRSEAKRLKRHGAGARVLKHLRSDVATATISSYSVDPRLNTDKKDADSKEQVHVVELEETAVWEWKVMKVHTNHAHEIIRNELSLIDPEELDELSQVANMPSGAMKALHKNKKHLSLKEIEPETLVTCITQFAQSECDKLSDHWSEDQRKGWDRSFSRDDPSVHSHYKALWHEARLAAKKARERPTKLEVAKGFWSALPSRRSWHNVDENGTGQRRPVDWSRLSGHDYWAGIRSVGRSTTLNLEAHQPYHSN